MSNVFSFAVERKFAAGNPTKEVKKPGVKFRPQILSVPEAARLLEVASDETVPYWAIALFVGLRPESELCRLDWSHIDLDDKELTVPAEDDESGETKTGRRIVKMHDNLIEWLRPYAKKAGKVAPSVNLVKKLRADRRRAGYGKPGSETPQERKAGAKLRRWIEDVTRHTFISNLVAECGDIGVVATQAGNSVDMIKRHYLSLLKQKHATPYWQIMPAAGAGKKVIRINSAA